MPFGTEKLEWYRYATAETVEDMFIRFDTVHERHTHTHTHTHTYRHTDRHRMTAYAALMRTIARQKPTVLTNLSQVRFVLPILDCRTITGLDWTYYAHHF